VTEEANIEIREAVRNFIVRSVNLNGLSDDDNLFESGIVNSLFAIQLLTFIEKTFDIEVTQDDLDIENFKSIEAAAAFVARKSSRVAA
jgi:acyl carrier protein